jgi:hypothetical protein
VPNRWSTIRRRDDEPAPGLDLSRAIVVGFLIAAAIGLLAGVSWLGYLWVSRALSGQ